MSFCVSFACLVCGSQSEPGFPYIHFTAYLTLLFPRPCNHVLQGESSERRRRDRGRTHEQQCNPEEEHSKGEGECSDSKHKGDSQRVFYDRRCCVRAHQVGVLSIVVEFLTDVVLLRHLAMDVSAAPMFIEHILRFRTYRSEQFDDYGERKFRAGPWSPHDHLTAYAVGCLQEALPQGLYF